MSDKINYVTPSLLNSWLFCINNEFADFQDFLDYLERKPKPTTKEQQRGLDFEDLVYQGLKEEYNPYVKGGLYQVKVKKPYKDIMVLGIIDVLQPNWIYDVKTTNNYEVGKYYKTTQHLIYPYCTGIHNFAYLINKECFVEEYHYQDGQCEKLIDDFMLWLHETDLYNTWKKYWVKPRKEIEKW